MTRVIKGILVTPFEIITPGYVTIDDGLITSVGDTRPNGELLDYSDCFVTPGFIDIHTHGGGGYDVMSGKPRDLDRLSKFLARGGVSSFLATISTTSLTKTEEVISIIEGKVGDTEGAKLIGIHMEGPYINTIRRGSQNPEYIRKPKLEELERIIRNSVIKMISLAPEIDGANEAIRWFKSRGITIAGGHSDASYIEAQRGIESGITHMTHLFNGMRRFHHREPGIVGAGLVDPRVSAEIIADGRHLHHVTLRLVVEAKGAEKTVMVSDSLPFAGLPDGEYCFSGQDIFVENGECRLKSGALAGSSIRLNEAVKNMIELAGVSISEAVMMVTFSPANVIGLQNRKGYLSPGLDADITVFKDYKPVMTMVEGKVVYQRNKQL